MNRQTLWDQFLVLFVLLVLAGCGGGAASTGAPSTTDLLLQSGFQAEPVRNPAHLQKLPGNQFTTVQQQGRTNYVYTDTNTNQLYFGSEGAYQRYQAKAAAAKAAAQQSSQNSMSPQDWTMYGSLHGVGP